MARLEAVVDGQKRLFALSTPSTDSLYPARLVPAAGLRRLPASELPDLRNLLGYPHDLVGVYQTTLEFPTFSVPFKFYVNEEPAREADQAVGVLGQDFMRAVGLDAAGFDWKRSRLLFRVGGAATWVPMGPAPDRQSEDALLQPTARRMTTTGFDLVVNAPFARQNPSQVQDFMRLLQSHGFTSPQGPEQPSLQELPTTSLVLLGLTASGLGPDAQPVQLAARAGAKTFNAYLLPAVIHPTVSQLTGLVKDGGVLLHRGKPVKTVSVEEAVRALLRFLDAFPGEVVVACHEAATCLVPLLAMAGSVGLLEELDKALGGLTDTEPLFRAKLPKRAEAGGEFSLKSLVRDKVPGGQVTHDALKDLQLLDELSRRLKVTEWQIIKASEPLKEFRYYKIYCGAPSSSNAEGSP